jgi:DNA-binding transcriptional LysR family regulator
MPTASRGYKALSLVELRCLSETARLGSLVAAAASLNLSHPTVWKQVHALERYFGVQLVETHARGCFLTSAGNLLLEMAGPAVESIGMLHERFQAAMLDTGIGLTIATTPRTLIEDLSPCVVRFHARSPKPCFRFLEMADEEVALAVQARRADFGFTPSPLTREQQRLLLSEPSYSLEVNLITPKDHPLARRRSVHPRDLRPYPIVNGPTEFPSPHVRSVLDQHGAYLGKEHRVQAYFTSAVRHFVALGFGIGLAPVSRFSPTQPELHERPMSRHFGRILVYLVRRRGAFTPPVGEEFIRLVHQELRPNPRRAESP